MTNHLRALVRSARQMRDELGMPKLARTEIRRDRRRMISPDPGIPRVLEAAFSWLEDAQDESASADGGIARHFSLESGWGASYPETSGYIIPTLLRGYPGGPNERYRARAEKVLDWLVSIQLPDGAFQGGYIGQTPVVPVTFNTGQILIGLASGVSELGDKYRDAMRRAADWLVWNQDPDGAWRKNLSPFAKAGEKTYATHVAWGLFEAARVEPDRGYAEAAIRNINWALGKQHASGWFSYCCLEDPSHPLTHTLGYTLRGVLEAYRFAGEQRFIEAALLTGEGLLSALRDDGHLAGRLGSDWSGAASWVCLTGSVQIAHCWLMLYAITGDRRFREAAARANSFVRARVQIDGPSGIRGGVKGSAPVYGDYGRYQYLNWGCKFLIDSCLLEQEIANAEAAAVVGSFNPWPRLGTIATEPSDQTVLRHEARQR